MDWRDEIIDHVASHTPGGYHAATPVASEPTALATLALVAFNKLEAAQRGAEWLAGIQRWDGSVGVTESGADPNWPTGPAILAWSAVGGFERHLDSAIKWTLADKGETGPRQAHIGHDTTIAGWSWAADTHSWLEPTAYFVMALKQAGHADHVRCRDGVRMLVDRLLPTGGANYGNTIVLGQPLLPHVQPTGLALLALAGESIADPRVEMSLAYLERELGPNTPAASLAFGVLGLAAHGQRPIDAARWLESASRREIGAEPSPFKLALLALASADMNPMLAT